MFSPQRRQPLARHFPGNLLQECGKLTLKFDKAALYREVQRHEDNLKTRLYCIQQKSRVLIFGDNPQDTSGLTAKSIAVRLGAHQPEAKMAAPAVRPSVAPATGEQAPSGIVPAPAAHHAVSPRRRACVIYLRSRWISAPPIPAPFPHISVHVK